MDWMERGSKVSSVTRSDSLSIHEVCKERPNDLHDLRVRIISETLHYLLLLIDSEVFLNVRVFYAEIWIMYPKRQHLNFF